MQENLMHSFSCQSDGWDPHVPPSLTWYLNGERQRQPTPNRGRLVMTSKPDSQVMTPGISFNSTFALQARKWDRELVCVALNPRTGESYNATVTLNVQCESKWDASRHQWHHQVLNAVSAICLPVQPEILRVKAHYSESPDPGLSLVFFALVRSNPPATITFVDQSGQLVANTSDFLILDSRSYPWLSNHTLRVTLSSLSGNVSLNASNIVGTAQSNLTLAGQWQGSVSRRHCGFAFTKLICGDLLLTVLPEFLQSRVEVPMLGIVTGGAMAFMALLILSLIVLCLMQKNKVKSFGECFCVWKSRKTLHR